MIDLLFITPGNLQNVETIHRGSRASYRDALTDYRIIEYDLLYLSYRIPASRDALCGTTCRTPSALRKYPPPYFAVHTLRYVYSIFTIKSYCTRKEPPMKPTGISGMTSNRRDFLKTTAAGATVAAAAVAGFYRPVAAQKKAIPLVFPMLPYPENALEPYLSAKTLHIHHDKHHRKYMDETLARIKGTDLQNSTLEQIIMATKDGINMTESLNLMAIMAWNHDFYWKSMKPKGGGELPPKLKAMIIEAFGSIDAFKKKFKEAAMTFGSGWAWLVLDKGKAMVTYTKYHESPLLLNQTPLLNIDTWEHAYYLDYQDRKGDYVDAFINNLANWSFAEGNLPAAAPATTAPAPSKMKVKK